MNHLETEINLDTVTRISCLKRGDSTTNGTRTKRISLNIHFMRNLRFSQGYTWSFNSSKMWSCSSVYIPTLRKYLVTSYLGPMRPRRGASRASKGCYTRPQTRRHLPEDLNQTIMTLNLRVYFTVTSLCWRTFASPSRDSKPFSALEQAMEIILDFENPCTLDRAKCYSWTVQTELAGSLLSESHAPNDARGR